MKVDRSSSLGSTSAARFGTSSSAGGFSLPDVSSASETAHAQSARAVSSVGSLDALLALQEVGGPLERRRKAVRRAGRILDVLDEIKLAMMDGDITPNNLDRLVAAVRLERGQADDSGLESVLNEIETRAAVEIAKLEMARAAA